MLVVLGVPIRKRTVLYQMVQWPNELVFHHSTYSLLSILACSDRQLPHEQNATSIVAR